MEIFSVSLRGAASNPKIVREVTRKLELELGIGSVVEKEGGKLFVLRADEDASRVLSAISEVETIECLVLNDQSKGSVSATTTVQERAKQARKSIIINLKNSATSSLTLESAKLKDGLWLIRVPASIGPGETVTFAAIASDTVIGGIDGHATFIISDTALHLKWTHIPLDGANYKYATTVPYHVSKTTSFGEAHSEASFTLLEIAGRHQEPAQARNVTHPVIVDGANAVPELIGEQFDRGEESWKQLLGKHARSVQATIVNRSEATLHLKNQNLTCGRWACSPPDVIFPNTSVEFGVVSGGALIGIDGTVEYEQLLPNASESAVESPSFCFIFRNPILGSNAFGLEVPMGFDKDCNSAHRAAAHVRYTVMDSFQQDRIELQKNASASSTTPIAKEEVTVGPSAASWHPLRILSLNTALIDVLGDLSPAERATSIAAAVTQLGAYDVVMLQGAFDDQARLVLRDALVANFNHLVPFSRDEDCCGMVVASKHAVDSYTLEKFDSTGLGADKNIQKGALSIVIKSERLGTLCLVSTDLQTDPDDTHTEWEAVTDKHIAVRALRQQQLSQLSTFIKKSTLNLQEAGAGNQMIILGGCLRVEAEEEGDEGMVPTLEYATMMSILEDGDEGSVLDLFRQTHPNLSECGYTWDFTQNSLVDHSLHFFVRDTYCFAFHRSDIPSSPPNILWSDVVPLGSTVESRLSPHFGVAALLRPAPLK